MHRCSRTTSGRGPLASGRRTRSAPSLQIAVVYHFDGKVYGAVPTFGEANNNCRPTYGIDAMRQFLIIQK